MRMNTHDIAISVKGSMARTRNIRGGCGASGTPHRWRGEKAMGVSCFGKQLGNFYKVTDIFQEKR